MTQPQEHESANPPAQRAREVLKTLPSGAQRLTLVCPLCGSNVPTRGLRPGSLRGVDAARWQLVFTCPACGLISAFDAQQLSPEQVRGMHGSRWTSQLREFMQAAEQEVPTYVQPVSPQAMLRTFLVTFVFWMLLIGNFNPTEVLWGAIVSLIIARITYRVSAFNLPTWTLDPRRWLALFQLLIEFTRQIIVQNITLSIRVLRPDLPIRPGIVAVPTALRSDVSLTILGSLTTLTPDTVTIDIDEKRGIMYLHWIDVQTTDSQEAQRMITASLEEKIARWLS
jgi:multicomponent Na+:H+ antiporter subunit E